MNITTRHIHATAMINRGSYSVALYDSGTAGRIGSQLVDLSTVRVYYNDTLLEKRHFGPQEGSSWDRGQWTELLHSVAAVLIQATVYLSECPTNLDLVLLPGNHNLMAGKVE